MRKLILLNKSIAIFLLLAGPDVGLRQRCRGEQQEDGDAFVQNDQFPHDCVSSIKVL